MTVPQLDEWPMHISPWPQGMWIIKAMNFLSLPPRLLRNGLPLHTISVGLLVVVKPLKSQHRGLHIETTVESSGPKLTRKTPSFSTAAISQIREVQQTPVTCYRGYKHTPAPRLFCKANNRNIRRCWRTTLSTVTTDTSQSSDECPSTELN